MKPILTLAGVLSAGLWLLAAAGCGQPTAAQSTDPEDSSTSNLARVTAGPPLRKTLAYETRQPGRIEAYEETPIYSKVTGYVKEIPVDIGDIVTKDETLLIRLWIPEMEDELAQKTALVDQAKAEVKQAEAAITAAKAMETTARAQVTQAQAGISRAEGDYERWNSEAERLRDLASRGSINAKLAEEARNQFKSAEAAREEAKAKVESANAELAAATANIAKAEADLTAAQARQTVAEANEKHTKTLNSYAEIKAPYNGIVTRRNVDTKHYVHPASGSSSQPLLVVASTEKVRVVVDIPELEAPLVDNGDTATVQIQSLRNRTLKASVTRTGWSLGSTNRSLRTEIQIDNDKLALRPGMYATVTIQLDERKDVLALPITAVIQNGTDSFCCCVESGKIVRKPIELGLRSGGEVEIVSGLTGSETVVLARAESLQEGQQVEVMQPAK